jgi:hypothetical protein
VVESLDVEGELDPPLLTFGYYLERITSHSLQYTQLLRDIQGYTDHINPFVTNQAVTMVTYHIDSRRIFVYGLCIVCSDKRTNVE